MGKIVCKALKFVAAVWARSSHEILVNLFSAIKSK
jgi:hypothetical protein